MRMRSSFFDYARRFNAKLSVRAVAANRTLFTGEQSRYMYLVCAMNFCASKLVTRHSCVSMQLQKNHHALAARVVYNRELRSECRRCGYKRVPPLRSTDCVCNRETTPHSFRKRTHTKNYYSINVRSTTKMLNGSETVI